MRCIDSVQTFNARRVILRHTVPSLINYLKLPTERDLIDLPFFPHTYNLFHTDSKFRQSDQMNSDTVLLITPSAALKRLKRMR